jgi:hypothetical protein
MAARPTAKAADKTADQDVPPYFIALVPLFITGQFSRAHNPGDRVSPDRVAKFGWASKVRPPDGYTTPDKQPPSEPETSSGQATTSEGKGDA